MTSPEPESEYSSTPESETTSEPESVSEYISSSPEPESEYLSPEPEYNSTSEPLSEYLSPEPEYSSTSEPLSEYLSPEPEYNSTSEPLSEYLTPEPEYNSTSEPLSEYLSPEPEYNVSSEPFSELFRPEPEFNSTSEPFSEFYTPESEFTIPESELTSPEPYTEPVAEAEVWPEPGPNWQQSYQDWGEAWPLHVYIFGLMYILLMLFGILLISAMFAGNKGQRRSKTTIALNAMISFFGGTRALTLFMDPYSSTKSVPFLLSHMLWSVGFPGLTASFSIVLLILLDTTKMDIAPPKFQKLSNIILITTLHLMIVSVVDVLVMFFGAQVKALLVFCQILFVIYGLALAIGFTYAGYMIKRNLSASDGVKDEQTLRLLRLTKTIYISAFISFSICVTNLYSAVSDFGVFSTKSFVESWPWWGLQTVLRLEEIAASLVVLTIFIKTSPTKTLIGYFSHLCPRKSNSINTSPHGKEISDPQWTETTTHAPKNVAWVSTTDTDRLRDENC
ncbi:proline-rich transmembrane protein 3-like [Haliotis cracherodii]|uniref:proline-rich transmembrane protein 3-like n=1 Tax=Haliotis cracherodii TaxID=6455 RepID=UPI0039EB234D